MPVLMRPRVSCAALALAAAGACSEPSGASGLHPEGPPMVLQVLLGERYVDSAMVSRVRLALAFGSHPLAEPSEVHPVDAALAFGNGLRVVVDELLVGNDLEEIGCRGTVDDDPPGGDRFGRVPAGATPDDIARCAVADDALQKSCDPDNRRSVCICRRAGGCTRNSGGAVAEGDPVGVLDVNQDGAADAARFIAGAVGIQCGAIAVPIDLDQTFWSPASDQDAPALGGLDELGPAIVVVPNGPLPAGTRCGLAFGDGVVDKQGERVCAPPRGDLAAGCTPGDLSAFSFGVEPLAVIASSIADLQTDVPRTMKLELGFNTPVDPATLAAALLVPAPPAPPARSSPMGIGLVLDFAAAPLAPQTQYTLTLPAAITDTFAQPLAQPRSYRFTTGD
jgi:hypothetical protein